MTHKEIREQSQRLLLLTGIKLFGTKGYDATSIVDIETELRGCLITNVNFEAVCSIALPHRQ